MSDTQEKQESEMSKYTTGYDSGLEGEQSMLCITRHDKDQDTIVAMYRGEEADIIQAAIESAKREGAIEELSRIDGFAYGTDYGKYQQQRLAQLEQSKEKSDE